MSRQMNKARHDVLVLMGHAKFMMDRLHTKEPPGWMWQYMALNRAYQSGYFAKYNWTAGPNYPRLVLARDELRAVCSQAVEPGEKS